jgi:hypothetical protein
MGKEEVVSGLSASLARDGAMVFDMRDEDHPFTAKCDTRQPGRTG